MKPVVWVALVLCTGAIPAGGAAEGSAADAPAPQANVPQDPLQVAERVKAALRDAPELRAQTVGVATHADTILLTGEVGEETQAARAVAVAEQAAGGMRISSQIEVVGGSADAGSESVTLVREVEKALRADQRTANLGVAVSIDDSQVIGLHGLVPSAENRRAAEDVAGRVTGVKRLRSHLVIPGE